SQDHTPSHYLYHHIFTLFPYTTLFRSLHDSEAPIADHVHLPVAASLRLVIALREDGITPRASEVEVREVGAAPDDSDVVAARALDRKSTRLNSSHVSISYAVFCLKKKK